MRPAASHSLHPRLIRFGILALGVAIILPPVAAQGRIVQSLEAFYAPAAVVVAKDGKTVFVTNAARESTGMLAGRGAISRAIFDPSGELRMENARFVTGLNSPLGLALLPSATGGGIPEGAIVVTLGGSWTVDANGRRLEPRDSGTGLAFFDPATGADLGRAYLGRGSGLETILGHGLQEPAAVTADHRGNIYVSDMAGAGTYQAGSDARPGVYRLTPDAVAMLLRGEVPPAGSVAFAPVANVPMGLYYDLVSDSLYWVTSNGIGELGGAVFRLPKGDFTGASALETVDKRLSSLAGIVRTPNGSIVCTSNNGDLLVIRKRGRAKAIKFRREHSFLSPGRLAAVSGTDPKKTYLIVPELSGGGLGPWRQRVQVVEVSGGI